MVNRTVDKRGYVSYMTESNESIRQHQLVALLDFRSTEIFDPDREVHHLCHFPSVSGVSLDLPGAVVPVHRDIHRELHHGVPGPASDDDNGADDSACRAPLSPPIEAVLGRENV